MASIERGAEASLLALGIAHADERAPMVVALLDGLALHRHARPRGAIRPAGHHRGAVLPAPRLRRGRRRGRGRGRCRHSGLEHLVAVHLAERVGDELDARSVGVAEVDRDAAVHLVLDPGLGEPGDECVPALGIHRDRHVVQPAEHLGVGPDVEAREVEEGQQVGVADVEEEVRGPGVVAVLDQLGQREPEHVLVEAHGALDVAADQRGVVQPAGGGGGS